MVDTAKMKRPKFAKFDGEPNGRVVHDDRGNAMWQWARKFDASGVPGPPDLSVLGNDTAPPDPVKPVEKKAAKLGYSPYESGRIMKQPQARRPTLQELSEIIKQSRGGEGPKK